MVFAADNSGLFKAVDEIKRVLTTLSGNTSSYNSGISADGTPTTTGTTTLSASALRLLSNASKRPASEMSSGLGSNSTAPSWMGSTTTANRAKKSKLSLQLNVYNGLNIPKHDSKDSCSGPEVGHAFLRLDFDSVLSSEVAVTLVRKAVKARLKFEAWAQGKMAEHELEEKRLIQERADFRMLDVQEKVGGDRANRDKNNNSSRTIQEINIGI